MARLKNSLKGNATLQSILEKDIQKDAFPSPPSPNLKTNDVIYTLVESSPKGLSYIDLTGRFPFKSAKGNQYILVAFHVDANAILGHAIKNRESNTLTEAWHRLNTKFAKAGVQPHTYVVDNEASLQ